MSNFEELEYLTDNDLDDISARIDLLEPWLKKTVWPPMTYMLIPSVLESATTLTDMLQTSTSDDEDRSKAMLEKITGLKDSFKKIP
jgi:hypothetical protein